MKIVKLKKHESYIFMIVEMDKYCKNINIPIGVLLLHQIYKLNEITVSRFFAEEEAEFGVYRNDVDYKSEESEELDKILSDVNKLAKLFKEENLSEWTLHGELLGESIGFEGRCYGKSFFVRTSASDESTIKNLLYKIEQDSYNYQVRC